MDINQTIKDREKQVEGFKYQIETLKESIKNGERDLRELKKLADKINKLLSIES
jgi:predicted RNase H-like nuclease (RuvC/YqgF family)